MKTVQFFVDPHEDGFWAYRERSVGTLPETPLHKILEWILQQLNFGNWEVERDESGDAVTLVLGKKAAPQPVFEEEVVEEVGKRLDAIALSGIHAKSREEGIEPKLGKLLRNADLNLKEWGKRNTEFHYAMELNKILARISKKFLKFSAPPIQGKASERAVWYFGEATRCYLYRLHQACIALCRSCLEEALITKIGLQTWEREQIRERSKYPNKNELEMLIDFAGRLGYLECCQKEAHEVRRRGNDIMHRRTVKQEESWEILVKTRGIVEQLFAEEEP